MGLVPDSIRPTVERIRQPIWRINRGLATILEGFTSPDNIALLVGTGGLQGAAGWALPAMFSTEMFSQNPQLLQGIKENLDEGRTGDAIELITITVATNALALFLSKTTIQRIRRGKNTIDPTAKDYLDALEKTMEKPEVKEKIEKELGDLEKAAINIEKARLDEKVRVQQLKRTPEEAIRPVKEPFEAQWELDGSFVFEAPRKVVGMSPDGKFVFFEGSKVGVPIEQVKRSKSTPEQRQRAIEEELKRREKMTDEEIAQEQAKDPRAGQLLKEKLAREQYEATTQEMFKPVVEPIGPLKERGIFEELQRGEQLKRIEAVRAKGEGTKRRDRIKKRAPKRIKERPLIKRSGSATKDLIKEIELIIRGPQAITQEAFVELMSSRRGREMPSSELIDRTEIISDRQTINLNALDNFYRALRFLEERFPSLTKIVPKIILASERDFYFEFLRSGGSGRSPNAWFSFDRANKSEKVVWIRDRNIQPEDLRVLVHSPQLKGGDTMVKMAKLSAHEPTPSVATYVNMLAHEFAHNRDVTRLGWDLYKMLYEFTEPVSKAELEHAAEITKAIGIKPAGYFEMLAERRAFAQGRTAMRSYWDAFRESVKGLVEAMGGDPTMIAAGLPIFSEAGWVRARPHFERAWKHLEQGGRDFNEFSDIMRERFSDNKNVEAYLERFRREMIGTGRIKNDDPPEPINEDKPIPPDVKPERRIEIMNEEAGLCKQHAKKWSQTFRDALSVEGRYDLAKATAAAVKNYYSVMTTMMNRGLKVAGDIAASVRKKGFHIKPNLEALQELALFAENGGRGMSEFQKSRYSRGLMIWNKWLSKAREMYKAAGSEFSSIDNLRQSVGRAVGRRESKGENAEILRLGLRALKTLKQVTPEAALWLEKRLIEDPQSAALALHRMVEQGKQKIDLPNLIDTGIINSADINILDIAGFLGKRLGEDIAQMDVRTAALKEGLAKKREKGVTGGTGFSGRWVRPPMKARMWRGLVVDKTLNAWIQRLVTPRSRGIEILQRGIGLIKMSAFYNPLFLPMYDVIQAGMIGALRPHFALSTLGGVYGGPIGAAAGAIAAESATRTLSRGFWHMMKQSDLYFEAEPLISSTPFPNPVADFTGAVNNLSRNVSFRKGQLAAAALSHGVELITDVPGLRVGKEFKAGKGLSTGERTLKTMTGLSPIKLMKDLYQISWGTAWTLDRGVRMSTYLWLKNRGFSHKEAGAMSARVHGDYASVPEETRRFLNVPFFTPTFKIAMGKLQLEMMTSATKGITGGPKAWLDVVQTAVGNSPGSRKLSKREAQMAAGVLWTGATLLGQHLFMLANGFETDEMFVKYKRKTMTEEGPQELIVTTPTPANLYIKYANRVMNAFSAGPQPALKSLANSFQWEITPAFRVASNMFNNKDDNNEPIVLATDSTIEKVWKYTKYALWNTMQILKFLYPEGAPEEEQQKAQLALSKEAGQLFEMSTRPFTFRYIKDKESMIIANKISRLQRDFIRNIREGRIRPDNVDEHAQRLKGIMDDLREDLIEEIQEPLP